MTNYLRRSIGFAFLSVLALASSASAECAWVVYALYHSGSEAKQAGAQPETWTAVVAFETQATCSVRAGEIARYAYQQADGTPSRLAKCLPVGVQP
jgi:cytochrome c556